MSTNTGLGLRPVEAHELDIVSGGLPASSQLPTAFLPYGWGWSGIKGGLFWSEATTAIYHPPLSGPWPVGVPVAP